VEPRSDRRVRIVYDEGKAPGVRRRAAVRQRWRGSSPSHVHRCRMASASARARLT